MNKLTYREAYDKIIQAYFKDEIMPFNANFCFCGTLAPAEFDKHGYKTWNDVKSPFRSAAHSYSAKEYAEMEGALLLPLNAKGKDPFYISAFHIVPDDPKWEDKLFKGMCDALDVLKEIHRSRGENVDEDFPTFTKRHLAHQQKIIQ